MSKINLRKFSNATITIKIQNLMPEKFINILWKNNISIRNIKKIDITTIIMDIRLKDYNTIKEFAQRTNTQINIIKRNGFEFYILKLKKRVSFIIGVILFICLLYYLSTFIWGIDIKTEKVVSPYEIRTMLTNLGIKPGISKRKIDVYKLEDEVMKNNSNIMWVKARIEGSRLKIKLAERQSPPEIVKDDAPCDLVAKKDGQIIRVYTVAGTSIVKEGDVVKKGDILVKGEQGKEESTYPVHAQGEVIARTFYEKIKSIPTVGVKKIRTGNRMENYYILISGKKLYIKNNLNKFKKYDKIVDNSSFLKKEIYYEVKEQPLNKNLDERIKQTKQELFNKIAIGLNKDNKIVDKIIEAKPNGDKYDIRVMLIIEENIATPIKG